MHVQFTAVEAAEQTTAMATSPLDELARQGARQMIALSLQLEVAEYIGTHAALRDEAGHCLVVRDGSAKPHTLIVGATPVTVQAPRVDDRRPGEKFTSQILPPYVRRSQRLEVYPETQRQRCWVHKIRNVLSKLPKRLQAKAKAQLHQIMDAPDRKSAEAEIALFQEEFGVKDAKVVACLAEHPEELLTFMGFPPEHWVHLRTTNPIEATFAPTRGRAQQTKGAGSRKAGLAMAFKLIESAQGRWRKINAPELAPLVQKNRRVAEEQPPAQSDREEALLAA
jgi:hypothetical protein